MTSYHCHRGSSYLAATRPFFRSADAPSAITMATALRRRAFSGSAGTRIVGTPINGNLCNSALITDEASGHSRVTSPTITISLGARGGNNHVHSAAKLLHIVRIAARALASLLSARLMRSSNEGRWAKRDLLIVTNGRTAGSQRSPNIRDFRSHIAAHADQLAHDRNPPQLHRSLAAAGGSRRSPCQCPPTR